jgi:hypothetical protein
MEAYRVLPFNNYKKMAEAIDRDMQERKTGPYRPGGGKTVGGSSSRRTPSAPQTQSGESSKATEKGKNLNRPSRDEARKQGLCYTSGEQGHLTRDCPNKQKKPEANSIRIASPPPVVPDYRQSRVNGRTYSSVVTGKAPMSNAPKVPTISVKENTSCTRLKTSQ